MENDRTMDTRLSEGTALWKMLARPQHSLQKGDDLINLRHFAKFTVIPKTSHDFRFHRAIEMSLLLFFKDE